MSADPDARARRRFLRRVSRLTWRYFEVFAGVQENWLPPDNYQEHPVAAVAHRTSPTNMGLALLANLTAHDFGYIGTGQLLERTATNRATVRLKNQAVLPNKDFILKYNVLGKKPEMAVLSYTESTMGYFMLMIQPKEDEKLAQQPPREIVFLIDVSGSMDLEGLVNGQMFLSGVVGDLGSRRGGGRGRLAAAPCAARSG